MAEAFKMPSWEEMATKIAHDYLDCERRAAQSAAAGDDKEAREFRKLAARFKKLMDKYAITIRA